MSLFEFRHGPITVAALAYVGIVTAGYWQHEGLDHHPIPLGAPMSVAVTTATSGVTASVVSSSYLPNPMGDEGIKAQPPTQVALSLAPPRPPEPRLRDVPRQPDGSATDDDSGDRR
jgi:hypothetical protein